MIEQSTAPASTACTPGSRITRSLLGYGVLAGPVYVVVSLAQALTRPGFDLTRHPWSLLSNGSLGWLQITNFVLTGLMVGALAVGLRRALRPGPGSTWAPRLVGAYGLSLVAAGVFRADPADGFPVGTPAGPAQVSWHGAVHFTAGAIGFSGLIAACFVLARRFAIDARRFAIEGRRGWAAYSRVTGVVFLAGFLAVATGAGASWATVTFVSSVLVVSAWLTAVSLHLYRTV
jgi:hypothetical protein